MTANGLLQIGLFLAILVAVVKPLGAYMALVYEGRPCGLDRLLGPVERLLYRLGGIRPEAEMGWKAYGAAMLLFNGLGLLALYALLRLQAWLPLNPDGRGAVAPDLAFNTAASFVTNTNWQAYAGEATLSPFLQMAGLTVQNFLSAATGMAILVALIRGLARKNADMLGNFWVDLIRSILYVLLPLTVPLSLLLVAQGVPQTFVAHQTVALAQSLPLGLPPAGSNSDPRTEVSSPPRSGQLPLTEQRLALGPVASQIAIKHVGTNGGGYFNANAAHPFENPTPLTDVLLLLAESMIAASLTYTFGRMVGDPRQGWTLLAAMLSVLTVFALAAYWAEADGNPLLAKPDIDVAGSEHQPGGNMEGKELRFGIVRSALFATVTTATSTGSVNAMHDSFTPVGGLVPLLLMQFGEVILGGVGSGLYGMIVFAIVAVFIAGLMVGRTPEYLGKKIEPHEIKMASLAILIMPMVVLGFTALAVSVDEGRASIFNPGPHGFSEILYAYSSQGNNNGSAFSGLNANTPFYNVTGGVAMLIARFGAAVPILAMAGALARKKQVPAGPGTLPTNTGLFATLLIGVVVMVGALTFVPALALGPLVEHLQMIGR